MKRRVTGLRNDAAEKEDDKVEGRIRGNETGKSKSSL